MQVSLCQWETLEGNENQQEKRVIVLLLTPEAVAAVQKRLLPKAMTVCCNNGNGYCNNRMGAMVGVMTIRLWMECLLLTFLETLQEKNYKFGAFTSQFKV